jgi:hypothetical protein
MVDDTGSAAKPCGLRPRGRGAAPADLQRSERPTVGPHARRRRSGLATADAGTAEAARQGTRGMTPEDYAAEPNTYRRDPPLG